MLENELPKDFEFEGEMSPDVALNPRLAAAYPFSRLSGPANVLVMPGLQSANISAKLLRELGGNATIGPMLLGHTGSLAGAEIGAAQVEHGVSPGDGQRRCRTSASYSLR